MGVNTVVPRRSTIDKLKAEVSGGFRNAGKVIFMLTRRWVNVETSLFSPGYGSKKHHRKNFMYAIVQTMADLDAKFDA